MTSTLHIVTVTTTISHKQTTTVQKFDTAKQAKKAFEKECLVFKQDSSWHIDPEECGSTIFIGTRTFQNRKLADVVVINISEEINIEYYAQKIEKAYGAKPTKDIRKILKSLYEKGYNEARDRYYL